MRRECRDLLAPTASLEFLSVVPLAPFIFVGSTPATLLLLESLGGNIQAPWRTAGGRVQITRPRRPKIAVIIAATLAVAFLVLALVLVLAETGPGEVSVSLRGGAIVVSLIAAAVFAVVALWFWYWEISWVRWLGLSCIAAFTLFVAFYLVAKKLGARA